MNWLAQCTVIQIMSILSSTNVDNILLLSVVLSAGMTSECVTYMTYIKDISEEGRRLGKLFYGFVPLSGFRLIMVRISMYMLSFCQLIGKCFGMSILYNLGGPVLVLQVLGGEMLAYLLYKVVRKDLVYSVSLKSKHLIIVFTLLQRISSKIVADFTGMLHCRHPYELGGFYWLLNMVYTQISLYVILQIRVGKGFGEDWEESGDRKFVEGGVLTYTDIWYIALGLSGFWLLGFVGFMWFCPSRYRKTFYDLR